MNAPTCPRCEQSMILSSCFRFDHEPGDDPRMSASLEAFKAMGLELGAMVSLYRCFACDLASALFEYDE